MSSNTGGDNGDEQENEDGGLGLTAQMEEKTIAEEIEEKKENEKNENEKNENEKKEKEASMQILKRKIPKKTKLEKSIEVLSNGFRAAAEKETEMMVKLEQMRQHEIRLKELENERRREERQHELLLLNVLSQNRNQVTSQDVHFWQQHMMYGSMNRMNPPASTVSQDESFGTLSSAEPP